MPPDDTITSPSSHSMVEDELFRLLSHDILNSLRSCSNTVDRALATIKRSSEPHTARILNQQLNDIRIHIGDVEAKLGLWTSDRRAAALSAGAEEILDAASRRRGDDLSPVNIRQEINLCVAAVRKILDQRRLRIDSLPRFPAHVKIASDTLRVILMNLLINAAHYSIPNSTIRINWQPASYGSTFSISNKGAPLGDGDELRLFDMGFRGENALRINEPGSGHGLYVVRRICALYSIGCAYSSREVNKGGSEGAIEHTFTLHFPSAILSA